MKNIKIAILCSFVLKFRFFPNEYRGNTVNSMRIKDVLMLNIAVL